MYYMSKLTEVWFTITTKKENYSRNRASEVTKNNKTNYFMNVI